MCSNIIRSYTARAVTANAEIGTADDDKSFLCEGDDDVVDDGKAHSKAYRL